MLRPPQDSGANTPDVRATAHKRSVRRVGTLGLLANLALATVKFAVGILANSQACLADAVHSLADTATDIAVVVGVHFWSAPADQHHPHGHGRIEAIVVSFIGVLLVVTACALGWHSLSAMAGGAGATPGAPVLAVALVSIIGKELLYRWTANVGTRVHSAALVANAWHHRSDALSSVPVAVAACIGLIIPDYHFVDHLAAIVVSAMLLRAAYKIVWPSLLELSDAGADRSVRRRILDLAHSVPGVREVHGLRTRRMGPGYQADLHVMVDADMTVEKGHDIAQEVTRRLTAEGPQVIDALVHLEPHCEHLSRKGGNL
jgi:cation diffusion facilitator family transporter